MADGIHPIAIALTITERGSKLGVFRDEYGEKCSIQESSRASESCIWLGRLDDGERHHVPSETASTRMHLTQAMVAGLLPHLQKFVETGNL